MKKYKIAIEETIVQEFEVWAKDDEEAVKTAERKYQNGEFVIESGECQFRQMAITDPNNEVTEWFEF